MEVERPKYVGDSAVWRPLGRWDVLRWLQDNLLYHPVYNCNLLRSLFLYGFSRPLQYMVICSYWKLKLTRVRFLTLTLAILTNHYYLSSLDFLVGKHCKRILPSDNSPCSRTQTSLWFLSRLRSLEPKAQVFSLLTTPSDLAPSRASPEHGKYGSLSSLFCSTGERSWRILIELFSH